MNTLKKLLSKEYIPLKRNILDMVQDMPIIYLAINNSKSTVIKKRKRCF